MNNISMSNKFNSYFLKFLFKTKKVKPIAISDIVNKSIINFFDLKYDIPTVYNGVNVEKFVNNIHLRDREYDFIYIGRFIEIKNPLEIIKAFEKLENNNFKMIMLGDGKLHNDCASYVFKNKIKNIKFVKYSNDVSYYLKKSKILILASSYEGNPIVINEAIASGCIVLATNVGGVSDIVNDKNGKLIEYKENLAEHLSSAMIETIEKVCDFELLLNKEYCENLKKVSIKNSVDSYLKIFKEEIK